MRLLLLRAIYFVTPKESLALGNFPFAIYSCCSCPCALLTHYLFHFLVRTTSKVLEILTAFHRCDDSIMLLQCTSTDEAPKRAETGLDVLRASRSISPDIDLIMRILEHT